MEAFAFYLMAALATAAAVLVVTERQVFNAALYLAAVLALVAGLFGFLGADFLAAAQVLLYVGGILVLIVFAVMLSSVRDGRARSQINAQWLPALAVSLAVAVAVVEAVRRSSFAAADVQAAPTTGALGMLLFNEMALPFEAVSLALLAALVGAVFFSRKERPDGAAGDAK